ncbi:MAG: histidinol-phosphatase HisJ family protein [Bacteroidales bacterium]
MNRTIANIVDSHTHSLFSPDSSTPIAEAAKAAERVGVAGFAITDHYDLNAPGETARFIFDPKEQQAQIAKEQQGTTLKILRGVELGLLPYNLEEMAQKLSTIQFDVVIASLHIVDGVDPYFQPYYDGKSSKEAYGRYLEQFYTLAEQYSDFDIFGHHDYIVRYAPYHERVLRYSQHSDILDTIFKYLIYNGKAFEINSATYRDRGGAVPQIDKDSIKRFVELGGELVSLGSDAHTSDRMGENFTPLLHLLKSCGVRYITHFENRKSFPQKINL